MIWLPLALACAFFVASADALCKRLLSDLPAPAIALVRIVLPGLLLAPLLFIETWPSLPMAFWGYMLAVTPLELLALTLYMRAITVSPLSLTLPYLALTPIFSALVGWLLLGEVMSTTGLVGVLLVALGAWLLNAHRARINGRIEALGPVRAVLEERGSRMMLAVAVIYGVTSVLGKAVLRYMDGLLLGAFYYAWLGAFALVAVLCLRPALLLHLTRRPRAQVAIGALGALEVLTHFIALQGVATAYMIAVKRTSLLFGIGYGALLFGERRIAQHLSAGILMVAGVALVAWG